MDTIFALSTAQGKAGVAVIRISGDRSLDALERLSGHVPSFRKATLQELYDEQGDRIDEALVLTFEAGKSFTGESIVELQCHGSVAVVAKLLDVLSAMDGLRLADPGEFTRRALENSNLNLAQVEGLSDLIEAETEAQRAQANRIFSGELGQKAQHWRELLIRAAALLEATIDFADEDVPEDVMPEVLSLIENVKSELSKEIAGASAAERIRSGFEVAIIGAPNVGKSTLINKLARREAAITSQYAGTTRDIIEVRMDLAGLPVTVLDTAGLRDTDDPVEAIGIDRATERAKQADLRVALCLPEEKPPLTLNEDDILLVAKSDLYGSPENGISGKTGFGVSELIESISLALSKRASNAGLAITARHRDAMMRGEENLRKALSTIENDQSTIELAAEEIRTSIRALDSLVGRIDVENLLDEIFLRFCIGK